MNKYFLFSLLLINIIKANETTLLKQPTPAQPMGYSSLTSEQRTKVDRQGCFARIATYSIPGIICMAVGANGVVVAPCPAAAGYAALTAVGVPPTVYPCLYFNLRKSNDCLCSLNERQTDCFERCLVNRVQHQP